MTFSVDKFGLAPLTPDALVLQFPCADCGCGSFCHWDDLATPAGGQSSLEWALEAAVLRVECQRCPCKAYKAKATTQEGKARE